MPKRNHPGLFIRSTKKEKAESTAGETGVSLGKIARIIYPGNQSNPFEVTVRGNSTNRPSGLLEYNQRITVRANISIEYYIKS